MDQRLLTTTSFQANRALPSRALLPSLPSPLPSRLPSPPLVPYLLEDAAKLCSAFARTDPGEFTGYVYDTDDLSRRLVVQIFVDGVPLQLAIAELYDASIAEIGDGCYGFRFSLPVDTVAEARTVEVRLANMRVLVGEPIELASKPSMEKAAQECGVRWIGGLRFTGWIERDDDPVPHVTARIDGHIVCESDARGWHQVGDARDGRAVPAFDLNLPERFADGCVHSVSIVDDEGADLPGSPIAFVAFDNGLEQTLSILGQSEHERLRGEFFDRLIPASLPMTSFERWTERFHNDAPVAVFTEMVGVVLAGHGDDELTVQSLSTQTHLKWVAGTLSPDEERQFEPEQLERFLGGEASDCDLLIFACSGLSLMRDAIARLVSALGQQPDAVAAYADIAVRGSSGELWPIFYPAFDYERLLEQGFGAYLFAVRRGALLAALNERPDNLFRLFNLLADDPSTAGRRIVHVPGPLAALAALDHDRDSAALAEATRQHLAARGIDAEVTVGQGALFPAVRINRVAAAATVSVIIPTRNQAGLLRRCLETIAPAVQRTGGEIIIADNDSSDTDTLELLDSLHSESVRVVRVPGAFNFSRINNVSAAEARGDYLCLLNNDIEALDDEWLDEMLGRISEPDVGAVGATLLWPSGLIQHAGVVLGPNLGAVHAFTDRIDDDPGYGDMLSVARECSAVTAACLLTRTEDYRAVGGMDEVFFPVNFNDVDYCLKLRALGRRIVMTPHARLLHLESASRGRDVQPDRAARMNRELRSLRARWLDVLADDPYYSPLLSLDSIPFSALAWPPRPRGPRFNMPPRPVDIPPGM